MEFESKLSSIRIGGKKWDKQKNEIKNINLYDVRDKLNNFIKIIKAIKFYKDYYSMIFNAGYEATHGKGLKILAPRQLLQRYTTALAQVKAGNTSENLLNEICQIIYSLYLAKEVT